MHCKDPSFLISLRRSVIYQWSHLKKKELEQNMFDDMLEALPKPTAQFQPAQETLKLNVQRVTLIAH